MGNKYGLHNLYLNDYAQVAKARHASSSQRQFPLEEQSRENPAMRVQNKFPANEKNWTEKKILSLDVTIDKEISSKGNVDASDNSLLKADHEEEASQRTIKKPLGRSLQTRMIPYWFKINSVPCTRTEMKPSVREELNEDDKEA